MMGGVQSDDYRETIDLESRIALQERLGTNPENWFTWLFDRLDLAAECRILELAAGPGTCWARNRDRIPAGWRFLLTDISPAMMAAARSALVVGLNGGSAAGETGRAGFCFALADVLAVPSRESRWDAVVANGIFDYLDEEGRAAAFQEVSRVLAPGGRLYAVAGGQRHLRELERLTRPFAPDADYGGDAEAFGIENGAAQLGEVFDGVRLYEYKDTMLFEDGRLLTRYLLSEAAVRERLSFEARGELARSVEREMEAQGAIRATLRKGLFVAGKRE